MLFLATEPLTDAITMAQGNKYTYRVRPSTYMQTKMLVEAVKAKGVKKWAIVAPNYEYGQSAAANFKKLIKAATPDAEIVGEQFPALGKIDAGATVAALENMPSPTASSTCCSAPTSRCSCARATRAACSRSAPWPAC